MLRASAWPCLDAPLLPTSLMAAASSFAPIPGRTCAHPRPGSSAASGLFPWTSSSSARCPTPCVHMQWLSRQCMHAQSPICVQATDHHWRQLPPNGPALPADYFTLQALLNHGTVCRRITTGGRKTRPGGCWTPNSNQRTDLAVLLCLCSRGRSRRPSGSPCGCADHRAEVKGRDSRRGCCTRSHQTGFRLARCLEHHTQPLGSQVCAYSALQRMPSEEYNRTMSASLRIAIL